MEAISARLREARGHAVSIKDIYVYVENAYPSHIDDERRPSPYDHTLKWHHDTQWALEKLVQNGEIQRRKELGRGWYSLP